MFTSSWCEFELHESADLLNLVIYNLNEENFEEDIIQSNEKSFS